MQKRNNKKYVGALCLPVPSLPAKCLTVDHTVGLAQLLPDLAVPLCQSGHLGEVVSPELDDPEAHSSKLVIDD